MVGKVLLFFTNIQAKFQFISVYTDSSGETLEIGCLPAAYSETIEDVSGAALAVMADPEDGCVKKNIAEQDSSFRNNLKGKIAVVRMDRDECDPNDFEIIEAAKKGEASALIFISDSSDRLLPPRLGNKLDKSSIPVCATSAEGGKLLTDFMDDNENVRINIDGVFPDDLDDIPSSRSSYLYTYVDVLVSSHHARISTCAHHTWAFSLTLSLPLKSSPTRQTPFSQKYRWGAANCLWNPEIADDEPPTGEVVRAEIEVSCPAWSTVWEAWLNDCRGCYTKKITNASELNGKIALFGNFDMGSFDFCHRTFELSALAQEAGAIGVVASSLLLRYINSVPLMVTPRYRPFKHDISTYLLPGNTILSFINVIESGEKLVIRLPPIIENSKMTTWTWPER